MHALGIVRDPLFKRHENGPHHPERPSRLEAIDEMLAAFEHRDRLHTLTPRDATHEEIARVHSPEHISRIAETRRREVTYLDPDTTAGPWSYAAALRAAGGCITAVDAVLDGEVEGAFVFARPPGHHAEPDRAMGFCLFNSVSIAAAHAVAGRGLQRVAVVDWDVHHGNGTSYSFYDRPDVLVISVHQHPLYPGTGAISELGRGPGTGYSINLPLPPGRRDEEYLAIIESVVLPALRWYRPQLIIVSSGYDADSRDPIAGMELSSEVFGGMTTAIRDSASAELGAGLLFVLEGGYSLAALQEGVEHTVRALLGERYRTTVDRMPPDSSALDRIVSDLRITHHQRW